MTWRDPGLYDYLPYDEKRPRITWPNGARVAFWVAPNIEFYEIDPPRNPSRGAWGKPHPDVVGYSYRDYGNRAGFWRMPTTTTSFATSARCTSSTRSRFRFAT